MINAMQYSQTIVKAAINYYKLRKFSINAKEMQDIITRLNM